MNSLPRLYYDIAIGRGSLISAMASNSMGDSLYSKVELSVTCTNLKDLDHFSKSDPVVFLFVKKGKEWIKLGRTEVIENNLNPKVLVYDSAVYTRTVKDCFKKFRLNMSVSSTPLFDYVGVESGLRD